MLDADERLSGPLASEVREAVQLNSFEAFEIPFQTEFMGRLMRFSGLGGEKHPRFFRKEAVAWTSGRSVHEKLAIHSGRLGRLRGAILHRPYRDLREYLEKAERYTDLAARDFAANGRTLSWRHEWIPAYEFVRSYFLNLGFLDGLPGLVWAALSAYHRRLRFFKIRGNSGPHLSLAPRSGERAG